MPVDPEQQPPRSPAAGTSNPVHQTGGRRSRSPALRVLDAGSPDDQTGNGGWNPTVEIRNAWRHLAHAGNPAPVPARVAVVLGTLFWAYRDGDQVWVTPRTTPERPTGGVLYPVDKRSVRSAAAARFHDLTGRREVASTAALVAAQLAWEGTAVPLENPIWVRWGRDAKGGLWWDPGSDKGFVRVQAGSWQVEPVPGCWFHRPGTFPILPLPEGGGDLDELWHYVPCDPDDRPLVVAWMLAATQPDPEFAAGVLYLTGSEGTAKTTSAETIARVTGAPAQPARFRRRDERDLLTAANAGWVLLLDNLSALDAEHSDLLCTLVTGFHETVRTLYTTAETTTLALRRPVIMTSIGLPVLRPDLIQRMIPVRLNDIPPESRRSRQDLTAELTAAAPRLAGALLDLLAAAQVSEVPAAIRLPRLADLGGLAVRADQLRSTDTLARLRQRQQELTSETVGDEDPFFATLRARVVGPWAGSAAELHRLLDPAGAMGRLHRDWPTAKGVSARLERHRQALIETGWTVVRTDPASGSGRGAIWNLAPPA